MIYIVIFIFTGSVWSPQIQWLPSTKYEIFIVSTRLIGNAQIIIFRQYWVTVLLADESRILTNHQYLEQSLFERDYRILFHCISSSFKI